MEFSISNDPELLNVFCKDMERQLDIYKPTNYWKVYCRRIKCELEKVGLNRFRRNYNLIKGYGTFPTLKKDVFGSSIKEKILRLIAKGPPFNLIRDRYERYIDSLVANSNIYIEKEISLLYRYLSKGKYSNLILSRVDDSCVGTPLSYDFNGRRYTSNILHQICLVSLLFHFEDYSAFEKILEIGGGYGALPEIFLKFRNNEIKFFVEVDIPPLVYITTQYLKAIFPNKVIDYRDIRNMKSITSSDINGKILVIPPWMLPSLDLKFDLFWNSASFQEMEKNVVDNYLSYICKNSKNIFINSMIEGHKKGAGKQIEPITFQWISDRIKAKGFNQKGFNKKCIEKSAFHIELPGYSIGYFTKFISD